VFSDCGHYTGVATAMNLSSCPVTYYSVKKKQWGHYQFLAAPPTPRPEPEKGERAYCEVSLQSPLAVCCLTHNHRRTKMKRMPLIFGLAIMGAAPTVEAVTINQVDILNGFVDVDENGAVNAADDLNNVAVWCNDSAPTQIDILNGGVDVTESAVVSSSDDLLNCDLNDENVIANISTPTTNQVDFLNGGVDVNEDGVVNALDDATDVKLFVLP
jgi:hypothetical protein